MSEAPLPALLLSPTSIPKQSQRRKRVQSEASAARGRLTDRALVDEIARGGRAALAEAHRRHHAKVTAAAQSVCDLKCAEEVTQDVFMRLWTLPGRFDAGRGSLGSFLSLEAHGRAVDLVRSRASRFGRERTAARLNPSRGGDPESEALERERAAHLHQALLHLPPREYEVIVLAFFGQLSYREVAERLDLPEGTAKSRIRNGIRRLRKLCD